MNNKVTAKMIRKVIKMLEKHKVKKPYYVKFKKVEDFGLEPDKLGYVKVKPLLELLKGEQNAR